MRRDTGDSVPSRPWLTPGMRIALPGPRMQSACRSLEDDQRNSARQSTPPRLHLIDPGSVPDIGPAGRVFREDRSQGRGR